MAINSDHNHAEIVVHRFKPNYMILLYNTWGSIT